jgi:hypothetical protein
MKYELGCKSFAKLVEETGHDGAIRANDAAPVGESVLEAKVNVPGPAS